MVPHCVSSLRAARRLRAGCAVALALVSVSVRARADDAPTFADRGDTEVRGTERTFAVLLNPLATAASAYGGEADFVLGSLAAVAVEGDVLLRAGRVATGIGAGLLVYPQGRPLHGFYVEPRVSLVRPLDDGVVRIDPAGDAVGFAATAGWQWTWEYGFTLRLGGGALYAVGAVRPDGSALLAPGWQPVFDGSLGWAF